MPKLTKQLTDTVNILTSLQRMHAEGRIPSGQRALLEQLLPVFRNDLLEVKEIAERTERAEKIIISSHTRIDLHDQPIA